jgi:predicted flap endonuclease-1-like 5' DNA nuclease/peptidoglycan hydrolase CwlO-like protein
MNPWIALIIGLLIGWLIELLIDVFYWRKRRLCPDDEALNLRASLEQAQTDNRTLQISLDENKNQLGQLETELSMRDARITGLTADLDAHRGEIDELNGRITALTSNLDIYTGEIDTLNGRIHQLEAALATRDNDLEVIRTELGGIDIEAKELGFGSIFASGGLALGSFWNNIKGRFSSLTADVATRDAKLGDIQTQFDATGGELESLKAQVGTLEANLATRDAEIGDLRVELDTKTVQLGKLEMNLEAKNIELSQLHSELGDIDAEVKELGIGSLFAGGRLALSGFFANLKDRFSGEAELETHSAEIDVSLAAKESEIDGLRLQVGDLEQKLSVCNASLVEMRSNLGADYKGSQGLSMVWGMSTTASDVLANRGIYTYNQLAATRADEVSDAIDLSSRYYPEMDIAAIHSSWVEQSRLASSGDWDDLYAYQQERFDLVSLRDDLKKIWGIGPKVEQVFNDNGIYLFAQLASVPPDRITEILRRAGSRFSMSTGKLHDTWPEQARLADKDDWDGFKALHNTLDWSKVQGE